MAEEKDIVPNTSDNKIEKKTSLFAAKKVGIAARIDAAKVQYDPLKMTHRIGIIPDDSGSMGGKKMQDCIAAVDEFLKTCNPMETSVAIYSFGKTWKLTTDLVSLSAQSKALSADYSTPLFGTMEKLHENEPITRCVIVSDGGPTDSQGMEKDTEIPYYKHEVVDTYVAAGIPCDTVYISGGYSLAVDSAKETLKKIAEKTGGIFLEFKDSGTFKKAFKYLTPAFRAYLTDGNFKKQIGAE